MALALRSDSALVHVKRPFFPMNESDNPWISADDRF